MTQSEIIAMARDASEAIRTDLQALMRAMGMSERNVCVDCQEKFGNRDWCSL